MMTSATGRKRNWNSPRRPPSGGSRAAFTLLELTIVLFILGLLVALMAPSFKGFFSTAKGVEATSGLRQSIRITQQRAANQGVVKVMMFNFETGTYYVPLPEKRGRRNQKFELIRQLPEGYRFVSIYFPETEEFVDREKARLEFFPDGTTRDSQVVMVETGKSGKAKRYLVVTVQGTTGYVSPPDVFRPDQFERRR
jgi:prepilin-type N-terminal cleavage/methylation domain-containing protein